MPDALAMALPTRGRRLNRALLIPMALIGLIVVLFIPVPTALLDLLLSLNITLAVLILMTTLYVQKPLDFSVFPSLLLLTTLTRLVLNVATTRLILSNSGSGGDRLLAAGHVVKAFGQFVAGNNPAIGLVIFVILVVIQFVVITKGATRISEVAARFVLDAMPQKQMSVDADLNAGLIDEAAARARRETVSREADFYGAMDGASKFVRGDAVAGIIITLVNILGGLAIGVIQYGMSAGEAAQVFTLLTIGDGLVSQIPAFIISVSAGLIVTRATAESNLGEDFIRQLTTSPVALYLAAGFLLLLLPTPLPKVPLLALSLGCIWLARRTKRRQDAARQERLQAAAPVKRQERAEDLLPVDLMELEVGVGLIGLVEPAQGGDLLDRIGQMRRQLAVELGLVVPPIRIRDNLRLDSHEYEIKIKGVPAARSALYPGEYLAMGPGATEGRLSGRPVREPAFGLPALWIPESERGQAEALGLTVVDASSVLATHLTETVRRHADELLTRQAVQALIDGAKQRAPKLVDEALGDSFKVGELQKVLQNLLREGVSIRDLETILEAVGDIAARTKDLEVLTEYARNALARRISLAHQSADGKVYCITMDPALEDAVSAGIEHSDRGSVLTLPPQTVSHINQAIARTLAPLTAAGHEPILLCSPQIRCQVKRLTESALPGLTVLSFNEIVRDVEVVTLGMVALTNGN
jgi:flagellar biosynthesis protein FlhA